MCGRYALYGPASSLEEVFEARIEGFEFNARYNAAPMQWLPVMLKSGLQHRANVSAN